MEIPSYTSSIRMSSPSLDSQSFGSQKEVETQAKLVKTSDSSKADERSNLDSEQSSGQITKKAKEEMVNELNDIVSSMKTGVAFRVDEDLKRDIITIYESSTGKVIRQIPDEEMLNTLKSLKESASVLLEKV